MGSLTQALSIALSGLQTSSSLISLAGNNISNAQTAGYTDKTADLASVTYGSNFGGVNIAGYSRATSLALTNNYNTSTTTAGYTSTQNGYMQQVQTILDSTSSDPQLSSDVANFASAWNQYASAPEDDIQQANVINAAQTLVNDVNSVSSQVTQLGISVDTDITNNVATLNGYLQQVSSLNSELSAASTSNQPTADLQDQMDQLVNKISGLTSVTVQSRPNGQSALYTPSGQLMVDGTSVQNFSTASTGTGLIIVSQNGSDVTSAFSGGSLQAALQFVDTSTSAANSTTPGVGTIAKLNAQITALTNAFTDTTNPNSFASTYAEAVTSSTATGAPQAGDDVASTFFTTSGSFAVNANLLSSAASLPQSGVQAIASSFNNTQNYTASGLSASNATYATLTTAILSNFQQAANNISTLSTTATSQQTYYQQALSNATGVNIDTELANLVAYQNSYAASAHVISTVNQMMTTLMSVIGS
jgi:flagellar hook-associated protein 1 FlgK